MARLDDATISEALGPLAWERVGDELVRVVERDDFAGAMTFVNSVAERAETANHHPDIDIRWNKVTLRLSTHSEGGITQSDIDLATEIDSIV